MLAATSSAAWRQHRTELEGAREMKKPAETGPNVDAPQEVAKTPPGLDSCGDGRDRAALLSECRVARPRGARPRYMTLSHLGRARRARVSSGSQIPRPHRRGLLLCPRAVTCPPAQRAYCPAADPSRAPRGFFVRRDPRRGMVCFRATPPFCRVVRLVDFVCLPTGALDYCLARLLRAICPAFTGGVFFVCSEFSPA
jgi:hypothetical protein